MISVSKMFREPPKIWNPYLQRNDRNPEFAQLVTPAFEMLKFSNAEMQNLVMKQNLKNSIWKCWNGWAMKIWNPAFTNVEAEMLKSRNTEKQNLLSKQNLNPAFLLRGIRNALS